MDSARAVVWKSVPDYPGLEASSEGAIRRGATILKDWSIRGYRAVRVNGKTARAHRLVASAFHRLPKPGEVINHIDGKKWNNRPGNLEWCTSSQNILHAYATGLHSGSKREGPEHYAYGRTGCLHHQSMAVIATWPTGRQQRFESQRLAGLAGFSPSKISMCINGIRKSHAGATWTPLPPPPAREDGR